MTGASALSIVLALLDCGGAEGPGRGQGQGHDAGETDEGLADYESMNACAIKYVCNTFLHDIEEGDTAYHPDGSEGFLPKEKCILEGLRDGKQGRYVAGYDDVNTGGSDVDTYVIHVHEGRMVTHAVHNELHDDEDGTVYDTYWPAETCTLEPAAYFDDCLTNHDGPSHFEACWQIHEWWTDCAPMGPRCE